MESRKVYIGGYSIISALGNTGSTISALEEGRSGLRKEHNSDVCARVDDSQFIATQHRSRFDKLLSSCMHNLLDECKLPAGTRFILASTKGAVDLIAGSNFPPEAFLCSSAERICRDYNLAPEPLVISNACISGLSALITAKRMIECGQCSHIVVAGCDILSDFVLEGFKSLQSVSSSNCRPYDIERNGLNLGEACAAIFLTCSSGAAIKPLISIEGGAISNDAYHISSPSRTGDGLAQAIDDAIEDAGIDKDEIDLINAHGTATIFNDEMESRAFALAGLSQKPTNSLKPYFGHTLGASGILETAICVHSMQNDIILATPGFSLQGTSRKLNIVTENISRELQCCLKTASGFGGCNAAIVLCKESRHMKTSKVNHEIHTAAECTMVHEGPDFKEFIKKEYQKLGETNLKFHQMSALCQAAYVAAGKLLSTDVLEGIDSKDTAIVLANSTSTMETDMEHQLNIESGETNRISPAVFVYTLPNIAIGQLCIKYGIKGDNSFFLRKKNDNFAEDYSRMLIEQGYAKAVICGWCNKAGEELNVNLKLLKRKTE